MEETNNERNLNESKELEIIARVKQGDIKAEEELEQLEANYVTKVAEQYKGKGLSLEVLIEEGNEGLIRAARKFDTSKGTCFMAYAVWWVRQYILKGIAYEMNLQNQNNHE